SQVEAWDRVAVAEVAALGPVDDRKELHADLPQPCADVVAGARHVLLGPAPWPHVLWVELGDSQPVLERQALVVGDPRAALLGRVDHEHAPESLPCQSTDLLGAASGELQVGSDLGASNASAIRGHHCPSITHASAIPGATLTSTSSGMPEASAVLSPSPSSSTSPTTRDLTP